MSTTADKLALEIQALPDVEKLRSLVYGTDQETVVVIAVAHLHREPRYWADRL